MPTSSTPPAPATPAAGATPRRRRRLLPSSASASFASSPSSPFSFFAPSPSPFHRFLPSPLRASTAVPFSWEHRPGIPKTPARARSSKAGKKPLPLPPSLLCRSDDPYDPSSVVPVEYAALPGGRSAGRLGRRVRVRRRRQRVGNALAEWCSAFSLYRSCKRAASCLAAKLKSA